MILEARVPKSEAPSAEPAEDTVLVALLSTAECHHLHHESMPRGVEVGLMMRIGKKRERRELEAAKRDSIADEEARQLRAIELAFGVSSSRFSQAEKRTTYGFIIVERGTIDGDVDAEDTSEDVQTTKGVGSGTPNPPAC